MPSICWPLGNFFGKLELKMLGNSAIAIHLTTCVGMKDSFL